MGKSLSMSHDVHGKSITKTRKNERTNIEHPTPYVLYHLRDFELSCFRDSLESLAQLQCGRVYRCRMMSTGRASRKHERTKGRTLNTPLHPFFLFFVISNFRAFVILLSLLRSFTVEESIDVA